MGEQRKGRHLVRITINGERRRIGSCATGEEAEELRAAVYSRASDVTGITLRAWGEQWLDRRERLDGLRSISTDRGRRRTHIGNSPLASMALVMITAKDVDAWICALQKKLTATPYRAPKPLSLATVKQVIGLLRQMLDDAMPQHITTNPVAALKKRVPKATKRRARDATVEPWTYLEPEEQHRLRTSDAIPEADRLIILFALLTGLRQGEQFNLELADLRLDADAPHVVVRFGSKNQPPKNGKIRRVYLSADAVDICRRWLALLPSYAPHNPEALVFPGARGGRVSEGKTRSSAARWSRSRPADGSRRRSTSSTATSTPRASPARSAGTTPATAAPARSSPDGGAVAGRSRRSASTSATRRSPRRTATRT
ncbi:uncharacterized protein SOCE836_040920 [Sorangium cellulosum]|uniref:Tyr recombinase domain-containing protein n=1 Tax=Sorangium cellulosum TaxID=56 RepID=A0A4P2QPS3_SORCE|nr:MULTISPECIES: tyrosine-type recombinase/integrase [Sorangium]AUX31956.1 uncharacterized protein SOCE836_040920 [Sorangium cellulosum]WCQ91330.1 integrase [Sorangium sp. Soce836]